MDVTITSIATTVRARSAAVSLRLNSVPLLYIHIESYRLEQEYGRAVREHSRLVLGGKLEGTLIGFETNRGRDDEHSRITLIATVVESSFESWLGQRAREDSPKLLVYQRKKDESPRQYLERLLDKKIDWEKAEDLEKENVFRKGACMWRTEDTTNIRFMHDVVAFLRLRKPSLEGWYAVGDPVKPIRIATRREHIVNITPAWRGGETVETDALVLPARGIDSARFKTGEFTLKRLFRLDNDREKTKLDALDKLATKGPPSASAGLPVIVDIDQILMGPGPMTLGKASYFAREVQYEVKFEVDSGADDSLEATVYLTTWNDGVTTTPFHNLRLPAQFIGWQEQSDDCVLTDLKPAGEDGSEAPWGLHEDGKIYTHVHTPSFVRDEHRGLYSTYIPDDALYVELRAGELPVMVGARQQHAKELEKGCMALNAERIATVTLPVSTDIMDQCGFYIQKDQAIDARTKTFTVDSEKKEINENWTITREKSTIVQDVKIDGNVRVYKKLNAGRGMTS